MNIPAISEALKMLNKAKDAILTSEHDLRGGFFLAVANRTYYTSYYCMTAMLYTRNIYAKTHQGTRAKFSEEFIKTAILPIEVSDNIALLFKYRQEADYDMEAEISGTEAQELISKAYSILQAVRQYFDQFNQDL